MASHGAKEKLVLGPDLRKDQPVKWLTVTAMLMALNIAMSSFGVPVPGGGAAETVKKACHCEEGKARRGNP